MNLKTTLALLVLVGAVGALVVVGWKVPPALEDSRWVSRPAPPPADAGSAAVLAGLKPSDLARLEVRAGGRTLVLQRNPEGGWALPGNWPAREERVKEFVDLLGRLNPRFEAVPLAEGDDLKRFGLDPPAVTVRVETVGDMRAAAAGGVGLLLGPGGAPLRSAVAQAGERGHRGHTLAFGEPPADGSRLARPTYVRVDRNPEVLQLAPGLVAALERPADYYQQRRLFPADRVPKGEETREKVARLKARGVTVAGEKGATFRLARGADGWELAEPARDRLDPARRDAFLEAVPDVWAERFVDTDLGAAAATWALPAAPLGPASAAAALFWNTRAGLLVKSGLDQPDRTLTVTTPDGAARALRVGRTSSVRERREPGGPVPGLPPGMRPPERTVREVYRYAKLDGNDQIFEVLDKGLSDVFVSAGELRDSRLARFKEEDARRLEVRHAGRTVVLVNDVDRDWAAAGAGAVGAAAGGPRLLLAAVAGLNPDRVKARWKMVRPLQASADADKVGDLLTRLSGLQAQEKDAWLAAWARPLGAVGAPAAPGAGPWLALAALAGRDTAAVEVTVQEEQKRDGEVVGHKTRVLTVQADADLVLKRLYARAAGWPRVDAVDYALADLLARKPPEYRGKRLFDFTADDLAHVSVGRVDRAALPAGVGLVGMPPGLGQVPAALLMGPEPATLLTLVREKDAWRLAAPVAADADTARAADLAARLAGLEVLEFLPDAGKEDKADRKYGLDVPAVRVRLAFKDKSRPPRTLLLGATRAGAPGFYGRLAGSDEVFAVADDVYDLLDRDSLAYRPQELWKLSGPEAVDHVRVRKAGQPEYTLRRKGEGWEVTGPFTVAAPADVVDRLVAALVAPRALRYRAHAAADLKPFGLDPPGVQVTLATEAGKEHTLLLGGDADLGRFGLVQGSKAVFVVSDALAGAADRSALDFLDRGLLKFAADAATGLRRQAGKDVLELEKKDGAWRLVKPAEEDADDRKVPALLRDLGALRAARVAAYDPKDLKPFGLADPAATLTVALGGDKPAKHVIEVGEVADKASGERYARVDGGKAVGVLPGALARRLLAPPLAFRDHRLAKFSSADVMRLEQGARKATFKDEGDKWKMTEPLAADVDHDAMQAFHDGLAELRADELVREKPAAADLERYGLGKKPAARWRLAAGDDGVLDLTVGAEEEGGRRRYARLAGKDVVFLLSPALSAAAVAEYRPRNIWKTPLDASQVESVRYGYAGGKAFELKKGDDGWQVVGKPGAPVNEAAVTAVLGALRDPKLARYVVDKGANLALFGLKPPDLALELTTAGGAKYALYVGGFEEGSKRRYAHLPEPGRGDVFLLDEADAARIVRDLGAFTRPAP